MQNVYLCGGTGAHIGAAFLRLHILGYALGYFERGGELMGLPKLFLVDRDHGDHDKKGQYTAAQLVKGLLDAHPARHRWSELRNGDRDIGMVKVEPLPVGSNRGLRWYEEHRDLASRFSSDPLLEVIAQDWQQRIPL